MKRLFSLLLAMLMVLSLAVPVSASVYKLPDFLKGRSVIYTQKTCHTDNKVQNLSDGIYLPGWYQWLCLTEDGFAELYTALETENAEMIIKYKGDYDYSASFTHWGSVSSVGCTDVVSENGYNYAIFDNNAVKSLFTNFANNKDNIDDQGNVKPPNALSVDGRGANGGNTVYGLWVIHGEKVNTETMHIATVDMDTTFQTIEGWGASYTWYSDWMVGLPCSAEGYDWIFDEAQFNILRFRDQHGLAGDEANEPKKGYPKYKGYYDAAIQHGIDPVVLVTSWGQYDRNLPFVEYNERAENGFCYYTLAKDEKGNYMYDELAEFCVQSIQYFFDAGIPVDYFSISNEIELQERHTDEQGNARNEAGFFFGQTETKDHCAYWKAHLAVYEAFQEAFGEDAPSIIGAETMSADKGLLSGYLDPLIERDPDCFEVVAHHLYGTTLTDRNFRTVGEYFKDYRIWQTEWYEHDYMKLGDVILNELVNENITAYLYWNGVWIEDDGNCLIEIDTFYNHAKVKRNGGHYVMAHYSRYVKPGYVRVDVKEYLNSRVGAFKSPDGSQLVVVVANDTDYDEIIELNLPYEYKSSIVRQSVEGGEYFKSLKEGFKQGMKIPSGSLTTIVLNLSNTKTEAPEEPKEETTKKTEATTEATTTEATTTEATTTTVTTTTEATTTTAVTTAEATTEEEKEEKPVDAEPVVDNTDSGTNAVLIVALVAVFAVGAVIGVMLILKKKN